jgi:RpiB/LacA/LacB family sugar-phosphate isomerase
VRVAIGADHAGFALKERLKRELVTLGHDVIDEGTTSEAPVDYPDHVIPVAERVSRHEADRGVVVCGSGVGASIAANKVIGVRAALVNDEDAARLSREHNDANVLALGARGLGSPEQAVGWMKTWLATPFAGERHARRVAKIEEYERQRSHEGQP